MEIAEISAFDADLIRRILSRIPNARALTRAGRYWSDYELLDLVRGFRTRAAYRGENLPDPDVVTRRFGSWTAARKLAGYCPDRFTFYVAKFPTHYMYGVASNVEERLEGYPEHSFIIREKLAYAEGIAKQLRNDIFFPEEDIFYRKGGYTECFTMPPSTKL